MIGRIALGVGALAVLGAALWFWNARGSVLRVPDVLPADFPQHGFSNDSFERLLTRFVHDGRVDYEAWHQDAEARAKLDRYLAAVARYSPHSSPERFPSESERRTYWMTAYNAMVIHAVLNRWPIATVHDVKAPLELKSGFGFFYRLRFVAGGKTYNLYDLERDEVIGPERDPRAHFVLVCASASCPAVRPDLPTGDELEVFLRDAAAAFVSEKRNVELDHSGRRIFLSRIFEWYQDDFLADLTRRALPRDRGIISYVRSVSPPELAAELDRTVGYTVEYRDYDWSLNDAATPSG